MWTWYQEKRLRDSDLSDDEEGVLLDNLAFTGLFPSGLLKPLLHKATAMADLQEDEPTAHTPTSGWGHGIFLEPVSRQSFIPAPKPFLDVVQYQWTNPASLLTPSGTPVPVPPPCDGERLESQVEGGSDLTMTRVR